MEQSADYKLGELSATVDSLKTDVAEIKADQKQQLMLLQKLVTKSAEERGARKVLIAIAGGGGIIGAFASWAFERFFAGPHS